MTNAMDGEKDYCDVHGIEMTDVGHHGVEEFVCLECFKDVKELRTRLEVANLGADKLADEIVRLRTRVAELEKRIVCTECGSTDLVCGKGWQKERNELQNRLSTLLKASEGMEKALEKVAVEWMSGIGCECGRGFLLKDSKCDCNECKLYRETEKTLDDFMAVKEGV